MLAASNRLPSLPVAQDNSLHVHDMRPYVPGDNRLTKVFTGAVVRLSTSRLGYRVAVLTHSSSLCIQHGFDQNLLKVNWSPDGSRVSAGSADRFVDTKA